MLLFGPPWQAGGPPRTMWIDGQRLVFNTGTPPAAASGTAAPTPAAGPMPAAPAPPPAGPAAAAVGPAAPPAAPPSEVEPFLDQWADFEAAADARQGPVRFDPADPTPPDGRAG
eukprot:11922907-Alexandrium_andersonii.AAC.1